MGKTPTLTISVASTFALIAAACSSPQAFTCSSSSQCPNGGTCQQATRYCSVPDPSCASGQRYVAGSGSLAGMCVLGSAGGAEASAAPEAVARLDMSLLMPERGSTPPPDSALGSPEAVPSTCTTGAAPVTLATGQTGALGIALDAANVYWVTLASSGHAAKVAKSGGAPTVLASAPSPVFAAIDSSYLYFTEYNGPLTRVPLAGGSASSLSPSLSAGVGVAVDSTSVFYTNRISGGAVYSVPLAGGSQTTLAGAQDNPYQLAVDANNIYWSNEGSAGTGSVMKMPLAGGAPVALATGQDSPHTLALDTTYVYFADDNAGTVNRVPIAGGAVTTLASGQPNAFAVAIDGRNIYWTTNTTGSGGVFEMPLAGGAVKTLASSQDKPKGIALDAQYVYWTTNGATSGGTVMKVCK